MIDQEWSGDRLAAERFATTEEIRAALLPEEVGEFDEALRLDDGADTAAFLRHWRRVALLSERNPEGHRAALAAVAEFRRTGQPSPGTVPWSVVKARLGLG